MQQGLDTVVVCTLAPIYPFLREELRTSAAGVTGEGLTFGARCVGAVCCVRVGADRRGRRLASFPTGSDRLK